MGEGRALPDPVMQQGRVEGVQEEALKGTGWSSVKTRRTVERRSNKDVWFDDLVSVCVVSGANRPSSTT